MDDPLEIPLTDELAEALQRVFKVPEVQQSLGEQFYKSLVANLGHARKRMIADTDIIASALENRDFDLAVAAGVDLLAGADVLSEALERLFLVYNPDKLGVSMEGEEAERFKDLLLEAHELHGVAGLLQ